MRKIAVSISKGGTAKSSTAVAIAHGLSLNKRRVLLIDTDDQGQDAFLLGVKPPKGLADVMNEDIDVKDAIFEARKNLWILAGGKALSGVKRSIGRKDYGAEQTLSELLESVEDQFDYCIIDTSPSWDSLTINALFMRLKCSLPFHLKCLQLIAW